MSINPTKRWNIKALRYSNSAPLTIDRIHASDFKESFMDGDWAFSLICDGHENASAPCRAKIFDCLAVKDRNGGILCRLAYCDRHGGVARAELEVATELPWLLPRESNSKSVIEYPRAIYVATSKSSG